jgi:uncharacterized protein GlcG (DUF336 family)
MLATKKSLTLGAAKAIAAAAEAEASKNNWNVVIAILDDGANLVYLQRMDGTQIGSIEVAQQKGACAIRFKRPSKAFAEMVNGGTPGMMSLRGVVPVEGGLPLTVNGQIVGAIGVSGVKSDQDGIVAKAGADLAAGLS